MDDQRFVHFQTTGQERLRLMDALDGYFDSAESAEHHEAYAAYLRKRRGPAADELARRMDMMHLSQLVSEGILDLRVIDDLAGRMADPAHPMQWMQVLMARDRLRRGESVTGTTPMTAGTQEGIQESTLGCTPERLPQAERRGSDVPDAADPGLKQRALHILRVCRRDLYTCFPYLYAAVCALDFVITDDCTTIGTDGEKLYANPTWVLDIWRSERCVLRRMYLHELLHCLFYHPWDLRGDDPMQRLAADIEIEFLIERECWESETLRTYLGELPRVGVWSSLYEELAGAIPPASVLFRRLPYLLTQEQSIKLRSIVCRDDHGRWPAGNTDSRWNAAGKNARDDHRREIRRRWEELSFDASGAAQEIAPASHAGKSSGGASQGALGIGRLAGLASETLPQIQRSKRNYRTFLQQFAVWQECLESDPESFDYIYYTLGLTQYQGMPLIEPLEYREGHRLEKLVIAIDTSGSVKNDTVRRFLEETRAILEEKENFFSSMEVWIIQCDCVIEDAAKICSRSDWDAYLRQLKIVGRAGTDFRPVFRYIEKQQEAGQMSGLKGLLYFTDGDGIYPREAPPYQTAFVFVEETTAMSMVPKWAQVLQVENV